MKILVIKKQIRGNLFSFIMTLKDVLYLLLFRKVLKQLNYFGNSTVNKLQIIIVWLRKNIKCYDLYQKPFTFIFCESKISDNNSNDFYVSGLRVETLGCLEVKLDNFKLSFHYKKMHPTIIASINHFQNQSIS